MIDQRTPGIEPPPSLDDILSHSDRIGRVDFNHRLVPEPAPEPEPERIEPADEDPAATAVPVEEPASFEATAVEEAPADEAGTAADLAEEVLGDGDRSVLWISHGTVGLDLVDQVVEMSAEPPSSEGAAACPRAPIA